MNCQPLTPNPKPQATKKLVSLSLKRQAETSFFAPLEKNGNICYNIIVCAHLFI